MMFVCCTRMIETPTLPIRSRSRRAGRGSSEGSRAREERARQLMRATTILLLTMVQIFFGVITLAFSFLRETHEFWLNSGGYPILLRDLVLVGYYPLLFLNFCLLSGLLIALCVKLVMPRGFLKYEFILLGCGWALLFASVGVSAKNNLQNFWNNRPLHYKPALEIR